MTSVFSAAGHDKLVLVYNSSDGNLAGTPGVAAVKYNGVSMATAIQANDNGNIINAGIFYLDNVVDDGVLRIELNNTSTYPLTYGFGL